MAAKYENAVKKPGNLSPRVKWLRDDWNADLWRDAMYAGEIGGYVNNPAIANKLNLSTETVNWYRKRLLAKFGAKNTVTLVKRALTEKIV